MTLVILDVEPRRAAHIAFAIRRYRTDLRNAGHDEPDGLREFEEAMTAAVRSGQERSAADIVGLGDHSPLRDREYLSPSEAAAVTGLSDKTIRRALSDASLPSTLIGRSRRIARSDLDEFMSPTEKAVTP